MEETWTGEDGHEYVTLIDAFGVEKEERVAHLVANAFIANAEGKQEVRHLNGDKLDNRAVNLEWV